MKTKFYKQTMRVSSKLNKIIFLLPLVVLATLSAVAHDVNGYTASCVSGPNYSVDAVVSNTNTTSYYGWQFKNTAGVWVCINNGNNQMNGNMYFVSGATSSATANPQPIVFHNSNSGLHGLVIRAVISHGSGVNPCTTPVGNTYNSGSNSINHTINVNNTNCGTSCVSSGTIQGGASVQFQGVTYTGVGSNIKSKFTYTVTSGCNPSISNFTFGTMSCTSCFSTASNFYNVTGGTHSFGTDNHTGICGIKYDVGLSCNASTTVSFTLNGYYGVGLITFGAKSGTSVGYVGICGPVCTTPSGLNLGNLVWNDADDDGIQDAGENGIGGVTVKLYQDNNADNDPDGAALATTTTNSSGQYGFSSLSAGNYLVGITPPSGFVGTATTSTSASPNNDNSTDNNGVNSEGGELRSNYITLAPGAEPTTDGDGNNGNLTLDFGLNNDCSCVTATTNLLLNPSFEGGSTSWSSSGGNVTTGTSYVMCGAKNGFLDHTSGTARIWQDVVIGSGAVVSLKAYAGTHTAGLSCSPKLSLIFLNSSNAEISRVDVNVTHDVGSSSQLALYTVNGTAPVGTVKVRVQGSITCNTLKLDAFCLTVSNGSIGDRVWNDTDGDGIQDSGELGISGVTVQLKNAGGTVIATTTTNLNGNYVFSGLSAGTYSVVFPTTVGSSPLTTANAGSNDDLDSDANTATGATGSIVLASGQIITNVDAGYIVCNGSIGDRVWEDLDSDGLQDTGEPGLSGITVQLKNAGGTVIATTTTNASGNYSFTGLAAATYTVVFPLTSGHMMLTAKNVGSNDNIDSDADQITGATATITLTCGQQITHVDAGYFECTGVIGDRVWLDSDNDGIQDAGEAGISGVLVQLKNSGAVVVATTTTNLTGNYVFFGLAAGTYTVQFPVLLNGSGLTTANAGSNDDVDSDAIPATGTTGNIVLSTGQLITNVDAGYGRPPVYNPDFNVTYVNVPVPGNVRTNDVVPGGTTYGVPALTSSPAASIQTITMNTNGTYTFVANKAGVYIYNVPVCVPGQTPPCPNTLLTITVLNNNVRNNPPVANTDVAYTKINTSVVLYTLSNDQAGNPGGSLNPASVTVTVAAMHGTSSINPANGNNTYTPAPGFTGYDTLTYQVCDNSTPAMCATAKQIILVSPNNIFNTTMAADDYVFTPVNTPVSGNAMTNDSDPESNTQTITPQTTTIAGKGTLVLAADGSFTFSPVNGFTGPVSFVYQTCDNGSPSACASATIYVLVSPALPVYNPDFNVTYVNVSVPGNVNTNDVVPAGTTYGTPIPVSAPAGSTVTLTMNPNGTYTFVSDKVGVYVYNVPVCVPGQVPPCPNSLLTITVLGPNIPNNPPVANTDIAYTNVNTPVNINTLANDKAGNPGGTLNPASVTVTVAAAHGTSAINPANGINTYTPNAGYTGYDTLTYQVCDNSIPALCATAKQIIFIQSNTAVNTTVAADDYAYTPINTAVSGNVKTNDTDPEGNTQTVTAQTSTVPGKGTLVLAANGSFTFTPVTGFTGPVSFVYTTCDNGVPQACANATLYILVSPAVIADFSPSHDIDALTFTAQTMTRDMVININEVLNGYSTGQLVFRVRKVSAFTITYNPAATSANVFGGVPVNNSDWIFTEDANFITVTLKPGEVITGFSYSPVGFTITRNAGVPVNTTQNITTTIVTGTGGDTNSANNQAVTSITAN